MTTDSVAARLHAAFPGMPLQLDQRGRVRLLSTPTMQRAHMRPQPLDRGLWRRLAGFWQRASPGLQTDETAQAPAPATRPWHRTGQRRRGLLMALILAQSALATWCMAAVLPYHGGRPMEAAILTLFAVLSAWVSAGFWTALLGAWLLWRGKDPWNIARRVPADAPIRKGTRTAILIPICNEDVARVFAGLRATWDSVQRAGALDHFDFFLLSDTSDPDLRVAELEAWARFCETKSAYGRLHYRRRQLRLKRKSGNIADWCRRWGRGYRYMVVLDADSVMSGATLLRLVQLMEANADTGIIQTAPQLSGRETLYARIQQFAHRVYGPLFTAGLHYWQLGESHYWGHNAILRVAPFTAHCALGKLPGRGPLAGEILSHDFVEAALMRRAGWAVWIAYDLPGSHEEMPPTLIDELKRDRRWCQGNLQNFRLFLAQGLHPAHRAVFMTGVMAYLSSPLWFLFLALSTAALAMQVLSPPAYFTEPQQLFPLWPQWRPEWALSLFAVTASLLLLPKILATLRLMRRAQDSRPFGGAARLFLSGLIETAFSALLAPIKMLFHTFFVVTTLVGYSVRWRSPPREDSQTSWSQALRMHGAGTLLGLAWTGFVAWLNPLFLVWLLPVAGSLMLAIPFSVWSSRVRYGRALRERRWFLTPEEAQPPRELRWMKAALRKSRSEDGGFLRACGDPALNALIVAAGRPRPLAPAQRAQRERRIRDALARGPQVLDEADRNVLLSDPVSMAQLYEALRTGGYADPRWRTRH